MSRARLFQRAAKWLKSRVQNQQAAESSRDRRRALKFAFGQLEERVVLDADFTWNGADLRLDAFTSLGSEALEVAETATHYQFTLNEGTWSGIDTATVSGDGNSTLSVEKSSGVQRIIADATGINIDFAGVDFDAAGTLTEIHFAGEDLSQTGAVLADTVGQVLLEGSHIEMRHTGNDFGSLMLDADVAEIGDIDDIVLDEVNVGTALSVAADGSILLADDISVPKIHLHAGDGVTQQASTFVGTMELLLSGEGDFVLTESNRIGQSFTAGKLAADIEGSLSLNNDFDLEVDELTYDFLDASSANLLGVTIGTGSSTGNLTITTSQDDITQTVGGKVVVAGLASFDVGVGDVALANAVAPGVGNDFHRVEIIEADEAEIWDTAGGMTILEVNTDDQALFAGFDLIRFNDTINAGARLAVVSFGGAFQDISSVINAEELIVVGTGNFSFRQANNIQNLSGFGQIAIDVDGNFQLENGGETRVDSLSYSLQNGVLFDPTGVDVSGNFLIELPDADFNQAADSAFEVDGTATFILGTGVLDLAFADENLDTVNDNDFGTVAVTSASIVEISDQNGYKIGNSFISDRARFESEVGGLTIDRDLRVINQLLFVSAGGMTQELATNIEAPEVLFYGSGDFVLDQMNSLGTSGLPAQIAAMIDGSLELKNDFGVNVASLVYTNLDTSELEIVGVTLDNTTGSGDLKFDIDESTVTQDDNAPVIVAGLTTFDVGTTGTVNLSFADTIVEPVGEEEFINENDFNTVAVDDGDTIEINDANSVTIVGAFTNNRLSVTSDTADIILDGNIDVAGIIKLHAQTGLTQTGGIIESPSILIMGEGYFDFSQQNSLGGIVTGVIAADVHGDLNFVNADRAQVGALSYTDLNGETSTAIGVGASGNQVLDSFRLKANGIELWQRTVADLVVLESNSGVTQLDTQTTDGLIDTLDLSLVGRGFVNLTENNLIGGNFTPGDVTIDWAGDVRLKSLFAIDFDAVTFTFKSGATRTDEGISIVGSGGALGNLELFTGGNITDAANIDTSIAGIASLIAADGDGDIVLGDAFSTTGGPNNVTHFGSIGFKARNASVTEDSDMHLDGVHLAGNLQVVAFGSIIQTGSDPFSNVGTSALEVEGTSRFIVDGDTLPGNHFNDTDGGDVLLLSRDNDDLIDNIFRGDVMIGGTLNTGGFNGSGTLRDVQYRNTAFEVNSFPMIEQDADPLKSLTVWVPRSSAHINQDLNILGNFSIFAGVDSVNGKTGASLELTDELLNRRITDEAGIEIQVGRNAIFETGNTIILADNADNALVVGRKLQTTTHGGEAGSRIRVGVAAGGNRGDDSGAVVTSELLRFRAKPTTVDNSEHASFNIDGDVEFTGPNIARSLMLIADGNITDDADADINVKNSTTLISETNGDILLGENFSTNFIDNNVHNFGTLAVRAGNVDITEDSAILLDGIRVTGNFSITAMGNIRQAGEDRFGQIGTHVIHVGGDATFRVDQQQAATDQLNDLIGQDVKILATPQKRLMDNVIDGEVIITTTAFSGTQNGQGSIRNVEVRNTSANAQDPVFNLAAGDRIRNLQIWVTNTGLNLRNDLRITNNFRIFAGVDSVNGLRDGRLQIVNNSVMRNLTDSVGVNLTVGRNLDFRVANRILLADDGADSIRVNQRSAFITLGGRQGNRIDVGTDVTAPRGTDSGAEVTTRILKYRAPVTGRFGNVTIVCDQPMTVTADSEAQSAMILP